MSTIVEILAAQSSSWKGHYGIAPQTVKRLWHAMRCPPAFRLAWRSSWLADGMVQSLSVICTEIRRDVSSFGPECQASVFPWEF